MADENPSFFSRAAKFTREGQVLQVCVQNWQQLRSDLRQHQLNRIEQLRFRRNTAPRMTPVELQKLMQVYKCTFDELVQAELESENA
jgi:hypothetical protein